MQDVGSALGGLARHPPRSAGSPCGWGDDGIDYGQERSQEDSNGNRRHGFDVDDLLRSAENLASQEQPLDEVDESHQVGRRRPRPVSDGFHFRRRLNSLTGTTSLLRSNAKKRFSFMEVDRRKLAWPSEGPHHLDIASDSLMPTDSIRDIDDILIDSIAPMEVELLSSGDRAPVRNNTRSDLNLSHIHTGFLNDPLIFSSLVSHPSAFDVDSLLGLADDYSSPADAGKEAGRTELTSTSIANLGKSHQWVTYNWSHVDLAGREYGLPETGFLYRPWTREGWIASDIEGLMQIGGTEPWDRNTSIALEESALRLAPDLAINVEEIRVHSHQVMRQRNELLNSYDITGE
ncbi:hypothetical protein BC829DRAFT_428991 [Chytridium lagenaria]|nr:hypothetical protein BC829DRAFT_428991 [Chytridium lagenaria]